jgi:nicotinamidase-related amidase
MTRGWEPFLTDRDKEHLAAGWADRVPIGLGERPALIVVDDYYAVLGIEREPILESVKTWPMSCGLEGWAAIDKTVELLSAARAADVPVIYLRGLDDFPSPWAPSRVQIETAEANELYKKMGNQIVAEVAPMPGELVIDKAAPSGFAGTPLQYHLNYLQIDSLIICGETTSGCVRATVVDATTNRYKVTVVEDCCFDRTEASHWMNLFDMHQKYADVLDLETTLELLTGRAAMLASSVAA